MLKLLATSNDEVISNLVYKFVLTPFPWLELSGFITTGESINNAASYASFGLETTYPSGTGICMSYKICFVMFLSDAMSAAMHDVVSKSVACTSLALLP